MSVEIFNINGDTGREIIKKYAEIGKIIKQAPSNFHHNLDEVIEYHDKSRVILKESEKFSSLDYKHSLNKFFIALVAPSLTGKTQSAFAIQSKLVLYFVFSSSQPIYEPFSDLSKQLKKLANEDVNVIKNDLIENDYWPKNSEDSYHVSLQDLHDTNVKLKTLGLLSALRRNPQRSRDNMRRHSWEPGSGS